MGKASDKIQHPLTIYKTKTKPTKHRNTGNILSLVRGISEKLTPHTTLKSERLSAVPLRLRMGEEYLFLSALFSNALQILDSEKRQEEQREY